MNDTAQSRTVVVTVISFVGVATFACIVGALFLTAQNKDPAQAWLAAGTGMGGLIAMLVTTHSSPPPPVADVPGEAPVLPGEAIQEEPPPTPAPKARRA